MLSNVKESKIIQIAPNVLDKTDINFAFHKARDPHLIYCSQRFFKTWHNVYNIVTYFGLKMSPYIFPKNILDFGDLWYCRLFDCLITDSSEHNKQYEILGS